MIQVVDGGQRDIKQELSEHALPPVGGCRPLLAVMLRLPS